MSFKRNQHVIPHQGGWAVRGAGAHRVTETFNREAEAVERGREIAQNQGAELLIHGKDGQIQSRDSHGHDPCPPKG